MRALTSHSNKDSRPLFRHPVEYIGRFSITASAYIRHWAIGDRRSSRKWAVSLNPGVRRATSQCPMRYS